jgi:hypothetical protein
LKKIFSIFLLFIFFHSHAFAADATGKVLGNVATGAVIGGAAGMAQQKIVETAAPGLSKSIGEFFASPAGILTISSIATVYSTTLYNAASEQVDESEANIKKIDKIMAEFKDSFSNYCPGGREDLTVAMCYCYLENGNQNNSRTKSQTCVDLWAKNNYKIIASAASYKGASKFVDPVGCLNVNGQFDEACKCKKFIDSAGKNACAQSTTISLPSGFASTLLKNTGLKDVMQLASNSANGNPMLNNFSNGSMGLKAVAAANFRNQMLKQLPTNGNKNLGMVQLNEKNIDQFSNAIFGQKAMANAIANSQSAIDLGKGGGGVNSSSSNTLKEAALKAGISLTEGRGLQNKKGAAKEAMNFNFAGETASGSGATQNFPEKEKNYNYKNSDISKNSDESIFNIISNRYIQSGLKRLFEN